MPALTHAHPAPRAPGPSFTPRPVVQVWPRCPRIYCFIRVNLFHVGRPRRRRAVEGRPGLTRGLNERAAPSRLAGSLGKGRARRVTVVSGEQRRFPKPAATGGGPGTCTRSCSHGRWTQRSSTAQVAGRRDGHLASPSSPWPAWNPRPSSGHLGPSVSLVHGELGVSWLRTTPAAQVPTPWGRRVQLCRVGSPVLSASLGPTHLSVSPPRSVSLYPPPLPRVGHLPQPRQCGHRPLGGSEPGRPQLSCPCRERGSNCRRPQLPAARGTSAKPRGDREACGDAVSASLRSPLPGAGWADSVLEC